MAAGSAQSVAVRLADMHQLKLLPPAIHQGLPQRRMFRLGQARILGNEGKCRVSRFTEHALVTDEMRYSELGEPGLARPKKLARAADFQIALGDGEAIVGLCQRSQPLFRLL